MYAQNLVTTFPLYARDSDCTHNRHWCAGKNNFVQPVPLTRLPPWVIKGPGSGTLGVWVNNRSTGDWIDLTSLLTVNSDTIDSVLYISYNWDSFSATSAVNYSGTRGGTPKGTITWQNFTAGCADLQMVVNKDTTLWYSELFYVKDDLPEDADGLVANDPTGCIFFDFADDATVGDIPYTEFAAGFAQRVFLPCDIGHPAYNVIIDGPEDGNRIQDPEFRQTIKAVSTQIMIPEYMLDALALMAIHKIKTLSDQYNVAATVEDVSIVPDWTISDCLSNTTITMRRWYARKYNC